MNALKESKQAGLIIKVKLSDNWPKNPSLNCRNPKLALARVISKKPYPEIQSDINDWERIMGKDCKINEIDTVSILWDKHDKLKDNKNFKPFGGFNSVHAKEYDGPVQVCDHSVDLGVFI